jgi:hypothetical protein
MRVRLDFKRPEWSRRLAGGLPIMSDIASQRAPPPPGLGHSTAWRRHGLLDRHSSDPTISPLYRDLLARYGAVALSGSGPAAPTA